MGAYVPSTVLGPGHTAMNTVPKTESMSQQSLQSNRQDIEPYPAMSVAGTQEIHGWEQEMLFQFPEELLCRSASLAGASDSGIRYK